MYSVIDIANWLLNKESMNYGKLQKLCYYAQAWTKALKNERLIDGEFEAWAHGPVNRTLWNRLREYGYIEVPSDTLENQASKLDENTCDFMERVWSTYGEYSGYQLECLTHQEQPWIKARKDLPDLAPSNNIIPINDMGQYYYSLVSHEGVGE